MNDVTYGLAAEIFQKSQLMLYVFITFIKLNIQSKSVYKCAECFACCELAGDHYIGFF